MKKRFTDEQVIAILREAEAGAAPIKALCKMHNISEQTFFRWRNRFGGMDVPDARRLIDSGDFLTMLALEMVWVDEVEGAVPPADGASTTNVVSLAGRRPPPNPLRR